MKLIMIWISFTVATGAAIAAYLVPFPSEVMLVGLGGMVATLAVGEKKLEDKDHKQTVINLRDMEIEQYGNIVSESLRDDLTRYNLPTRPDPRPTRPNPGIVSRR